MAEKKKKPKKLRLWIQGGFAALSNGYLLGFGKGKIYTGPLKVLCHPGLNCYSCPGALGSCPIGSLQAFATGREYRAALYVFGFLTVLGTLSGRLICGFFCPFGWIQDLLHKIPFPKKIRKLPGEKYWRLLRYGVLLFLVLLLPALLHDAFGFGAPWFCQYLCPAGTLEAGIPLVLTNGHFQSAVGGLFFWKLGVLLGILILSVLLYRPFCRYLCPLGALYGFFNRFAVYRFYIDTAACVKCGACQQACKLDIPVWQDPNSTHCIRCGDCRHACPVGAIKTTLQKK